MEEKIIFLRAYGKKKKRHASSIKIEVTATNYYNMVNGDSYNIIMSGYGNLTGMITLQIGQTVVIKPGDKIEIEGELVPAVISARIKR